MSARVDHLVAVPAHFPQPPELAGAQAQEVPLSLSGSPLLKPEVSE